MIDILDKDFSLLVTRLLKNCEGENIKMVPYEKLRSPQTQAVYWVQGRNKIDIYKKILKLKNDKAFFLAECIEQAEKKHGKIITNAIPGLSWHQWGEAMDCYWLKDGKICWDLEIKDENENNGYEIYAQEARKIGLDAGFYWENMIDAVHVQLQNYSSPLKIYSIKEIDEIMCDTFG